MEPVASLIDTSWPDREFDLEYCRVASKLGVTVVPSVAWRKLGDVLTELGIPVYSLAAVDKYLRSKAAEVQQKNNGRGYTHYVWRPLRESDVDRAEYGSYKSQFASSPYGMRYNPQYHPYDKAVPLPVLLTAERIEERLPGEVSFFVSDIVSYPDPFLAVQLKADRQKTMFVVERWDEPSFRG